jgi:hypothetical protein
MANTTWSTTDRLNVTLSGGNLVVTNSASAGGVRSVDKLLTGKYYWEIVNSTASANSVVGVAPSGASLATAASGVGWAGVNCSNGNIAINGTGQTGIGAIASGASICIALDLSNQRVWFRNGAAGNWNGSAANNPATNVGGYSIALLGGPAYPFYALMECTGGSGVVTANFDTAFGRGARRFHQRFYCGGRGSNAPLHPGRRRPLGWHAAFGPR